MLGVEGRTAESIEDKQGKRITSKLLYCFLA